MSLSVSSRRYPSPESRADFYARLEERLSGISGVSAAAVSSHTPYKGWGSSPLAVDGRDASGDKVR